MARKILTHEKHGTTWKIHRDLIDSPGLAFIQDYLSRYDLSGLAYVRLVPGAWGYNERSRWTNNCAGTYHSSSDPPYITAKVNRRTSYPSVGYTTQIVPGTWRKKEKVAVERLDINEAVVEIVAHEVCHHLHAMGQLESRGRYYWEVECGDFEQQAVEAYRATKHHAEETAVGLRQAPEPVVEAVTAAKRCDQCGRNLSAGRSSRGRFCSDGCRNAFHNARRHERLTQAWDRVCEVCSTEFSSRRSDTRYCSHACRQRAYRERQ